MTRRVLVALLPFAAILAGPGAALAAINEAYKPQNEFKLDPWISIGPIEFNKAVLYLFVATALTCVTMVYVARRMQRAPEPRADRRRDAPTCSCATTSRAGTWTTGWRRSGSRSSGRCSCSSGSRT